MRTPESSSTPIDSTLWVASQSYKAQKAAPQTQAFVDGVRCPNDDCAAQGQPPLRAVPTARSRRRAVARRLRTRRVAARRHLARARVPPVEAHRPRGDAITSTPRPRRGGTAESGSFARKRIASQRRDAPRPRVAATRRGEATRQPLRLLADSIKTVSARYRELAVPVLTSRLLWLERELAHDIYAPPQDLVTQQPFYRELERLCAVLRCRTRVRRAELPKTGRPRRGSTRGDESVPRPERGSTRGDESPDGKRSTSPAGTRPRSTPWPRWQNGAGPPRRGRRRRPSDARATSAAAFR